MGSHLRSKLLVPRPGLRLSHWRRVSDIEPCNGPTSTNLCAAIALDAFARGEQVAAVASGKPLTTTEAANLLGMSRTHLSRLCKEGRVPSFPVGNSLRIESETVMTILRERGRIRIEAREAAATAEDRRRARATRAAGID